jgi:uncharacterized protein YbcV (DUF1398 family)
MTFSKETIINLKKEAVSQNWPFLKSFAALHAAGVRAYEVEIATCQTIYYGDNSSFQQRLADFYPTLVSLTIAPKFNKEVFQETLHAVQRQRIDYPTFLHDIAKAGVARYRVDMKLRTVSYYGKDNTVQVEQIPS